jgi:enoyl-CoA hydratase
MSDDYQVVVWERHGTVDVCTINRPKALNALNGEVLDALNEGFRARHSDPDLRAIVLTGAGGKAFVAGADIAEMRSFSPQEAEVFAGRGHQVGEMIHRTPVPVIAAVDGFALGGGCELAMACDLIIAGPRAKFGQPEVKLGLIPGFGGTQRLTRRVGLARALDLCLTGRMVGAQEAATMGLVSRVVEGSALEAAKEVAAKIAKMGPTAVRLAKRVMHENADTHLNAALAAEQTAFGLCFSTEDQKEGMDAFLEKRSANFTGR